MEVRLAEFAKLVPAYYGKYSQDKYFSGYCALMGQLPPKARQHNCLEKEDLLDILRWGGDDWRFPNWSEQATDTIRDRTKAAFLSIETEDAYRAITELQDWGLTYGSKTLMFMNPARYVALDSNIRKGLEPLLLSIRDGRGQYDRNSQVRGYRKFLKICRSLQEQVKDPPPRPTPEWPKDPDGRWLLADIQQAIFQFTQEDNAIVP